MKLMGESLRTSVLLVVLLFLSLGYIPLTCAYPIFRITVGSDKPSYAQYETVIVSGTVTLEEKPLGGLSVALEVEDEQGNIVAEGSNQTDEDGFFMFASGLSPNTGSQNHTAYGSAQWGSQIAVSCVTFMMEALESKQCHVDSGDQSTISSVVTLVLLVLIGILLSSVSAILVFYLLESARTEVETEPSVQSETRISGSYRTCVNCGHRSLRIHAFCRHCLAYLG